MTEPLLIVAFPDDATDVVLPKFPTDKYTLGHIGPNVVKFTYRSNIPLYPGYLGPSLRHLILHRYNYSLVDIIPHGVEELCIENGDIDSLVIPPTVTSLSVSSGGATPEVSISRITMPRSITKLELKHVWIDSVIPDHIKNLRIDGYPGERTNAMYLPDKLEILDINTRLTLPELDNGPYSYNESESESASDDDDNDKYGNVPHVLPDSLQVLALRNKRYTVDWRQVKRPENLHTLSVRCVQNLLELVENFSDCTIILCGISVPKYKFCKQMVNGFYLHDTINISTILDYNNDEIIVTGLEPYPFGPGYMVKIYHRENYIPPTCQKSARK